MSVSTPKCLSILICDQVIEDRLTGNKSFIGTFNGIFSNKFPAIHPRMAIAAALSEFEGKAEVQVEIVREFQRDDIPEEKKIFECKISIESPSRLAVLDLIVQVQNLPIEAEGVHRIRVNALSDQGLKILGYRTFVVQQVRPQK